MDQEAENQELMAAAEALTAEAEAPAELDDQPGTFRMAVKVSLVICVLGVAAGIAGEEGVAIMGVITAIGAGLVVLIGGISDLLTPRARDRRTSLKGVQTYFKSIQKGRFDIAVAALAPIARRRTVLVPDISELKSVRKAHTRNSKKELREYWKTLVRPHGSMNRRLAHLKLTPLDTEGNMHRYRVEMRVDYYPTWILIGILAGLLPVIILIAILTKKYRTTFDVTVFKHKSQWWVLDGEMRAPIAVPGALGHRIPEARVV